MGREKYIYTDKRTSARSIMSVILGSISLISMAVVLWLSYMNDGATVHGYGYTVVFAVIYSLTGLGLGLVTVQNKEYFRLFPVLGVILNCLSLCCIGFIYRASILL